MLSGAVYSERRGKVRASKIEPLFPAVRNRLEEDTEFSIATRFLHPRIRDTHGGLLKLQGAVCRQYLYMNAVERRFKSKD